MRGSEDTLTFLKGVFKQKIAVERVAMESISGEESAEMTTIRRQAGEERVAVWLGRIASIDRALTAEKE
jgi:hypothetical protein